MSSPPSNQPIPRGEAFRFWWKLGWISFGGPAGQIAIMFKELVERRRWISAGRFFHALNFCMVLPGPEAQQLATYLGWLMHGKLGGIVAGALFVLPSLILILAVSALYLSVSHLAITAVVLATVKPAVVAIIATAALRIGKQVLRAPAPLAVAGMAFAALELQVPYPLVLGFAAAVGMVAHRIAPHWFVLVRKHDESPSQPALIDDNTPTPPHATFSAASLVATLVAFLGLWFASFAVLVACFGWDHTLVDMAVFFSKTALVTFGGAYAVLPFVHAAAVDRFRWLSSQQMLDGLAFGESTPGPLIMVLIFVGYLGGVQRIEAPIDGHYAGLIAGVVTCWFIFLPSFLFIFVGGPLVERTRNIVVLNAPLAAVTAAVVGVIAHLAVFLGKEVLTDSAPEFTIQWVELSLAILALAALQMPKVTPARVILAAVVLGTVRAAAC